MIRTTRPGTRPTVVCAMLLAIAMGLSLHLCCAGPQPLSMAIRPADQDEYVKRLNKENYNGRRAWLKWQAERRGSSVIELEEADRAIPANRNPFDAYDDPAAVSLGAVIFKFHCARCHGDDAAGSGPALLPGSKAKDFHAVKPRIASTLYRGRPVKWFRDIHDGRGNTVQYPDEAPGPEMPAFGNKLAREQIWLVITYLQSLNMHAGK